MNGVKDDDHGDATVTETELARDPRAVAELVDRHDRVVVVRESSGAQCMVISRQRGSLDDR